MQLSGKLNHWPLIGRPPHSLHMQENKQFQHYMLKAASNKTVSNVWDEKDLLLEGGPFQKVKQKGGGLCTL